MLLKTLCFLWLCTLLAGSCRRDAKETPPAAAKGNLADVLARQIKERGHPITVPVNKSVPAMLLDAKGQEINTSHSARVLTTPPEFCEDPSEAVVGPNMLQSIRWTIYDCEDVKHTITLQWQIRSSFDLSMTNLSNPSLISKGRIRIKNGATITYQDLNIPLTALTYTGDDPNEPGTKLYTLTYTKTGIPGQYLTAGAYTAIETSPFVYTDCDYGYSIQTAYTPISPSVATGLAPCDRIDAVYITAATPQQPPISTIACGMIGGSYPVGSPGACQNYTFNMASQVQVKKAGDPDANYRNIWAYIPGSGQPSPQDGLIYYWEIRVLEQFQFYVPGVTNASFPGDFTFRWRNAHGAAPNTCYGPWSTPVTMTFYDF